MIRVTTNGLLNSYRYNLMKSTISRNEAMTTVLTQRNFNSYAEDPAAAAQAFQLRRSFLRTDSQITVSESVVRKFESAWSALDSIVADIDNGTTGSAWESVLEAANDPTGGGRNALGTQLTQLADNIVQSLNTRYGDSFIFAGADGLNVPFTWEEQADGSKDQPVHHGQQQPVRGDPAGILRPVFAQTAADQGIQANTGTNGNSDEQILYGENQRDGG